MVFTVEFFKRPLVRKIFLFCATGGVATLLDMLFFNLFFITTSMFVLSRIGGIFISMIFNFSSNRNITFRAKNEKAKNQAWKFVIVYAISMSANVFVGKLVLFLLSDSLLSANIAALSGLAISIPLSFFGLMFWVFKK